MRSISVHQKCTKTHLQQCAGPKNFVPAFHNAFITTTPLLTTVQRYCAACDRKIANSTPCKIVTHEDVNLKLGTRDYVIWMFSHTYMLSCIQPHPYTQLAILWTRNDEKYRVPHFTFITCTPSKSEVVILAIVSVDNSYTYLVMGERRTVRWVYLL